ncbi:MAG: hypothetical protein F6K11_24615, partial [Leptolyngbya sp. SIO3F4]|nr:hypothetical protein [Leptolyngbya sp. SIO3F4]
MINTLTNTTNTISYPLFSPNQVLSDHDLNCMVAYLESQDRLSRNHFMGMGIACGLQPGATYQIGQDPIATITISPGSGITSEGFVVSSSEIVTLTHYQEPQEIDANQFKVSPATKDKTAESSDSTVLYSVTELFTSQGENANRKSIEMMGASQDEFEQILACHILIILCDLEDVPRDTCLLDCDDLGSDRNFTPRYFLVPKKATDEASRLSADALLTDGYATEAISAQWENRFKENNVKENELVRRIFEYRQSFFQSHTIKVPRFGYTDDNFPSDNDFAPPLAEIENYSTFLERYKTLCEQTIEEIGNVLPDVVGIFSPFFSSFQPQPDEFEGVSNRLSTQLENIVANSTSPNLSTEIEPETEYTIQYFYDYLVQIVAAYDELVHAAFDLMDDCLPDIRRFPNFLMLGSIRVDSSTDASADSSALSMPLSNLGDPYRSHFVQPPLYNQNHQRRRQVRHLYDRLVRLCAENSFN